MIKAEELQEWHLEQIIPRVEYKGEDVRKLSAVIGSERVFAAALVDNDLVLAIVGGNIIWDGVVSAWAVISESVKGCPIQFHKEVLNLVNTAFDMKIHRMDFTVKASFVEGNKWALALGFEHEATLYKYGPNMEDYNLYVRFE